MAHSPSDKDMDVGEDIENNNEAMKSVPENNKTNYNPLRITENKSQLDEKSYEKRCNGFIDLKSDGGNVIGDLEGNVRNSYIHKDISDDDDDNVDLVIDEDIDTSNPERRSIGANDTSNHEKRSISANDTSNHERRSIGANDTSNHESRSISVNDTSNQESRSNGANEKSKVDLFMPKTMVDYPINNNNEPSNAIEKMKSMFPESKFPIPSLASENPSISQHLGQMPVVIEPQPMFEDHYTSRGEKRNSSFSTPTNPTPPKRCAPVREAVDPAKYITVQEGDGIKYACSKCGNIYKWRKSLNKHWKEKHDGEIPEPRSNTMPTLPLPKITPNSFRPSPSSRTVQHVSPRNIQLSPRDVAQYNVNTSEYPYRSPLARNTFNQNSKKYEYPTSTPKQKTPTSLTSPRMMDSSLTSPRVIDSMFKTTKSSPLNNFNSSVMEYLKQQQQPHSPIKPIQHDSKQQNQVSPPVAHSNKTTPRYIPPRPVSLDAPIDLTRELDLIVPPRREPETILDLSKKRPSTLRIHTQFALPPQDEPLDFSQKNSPVSENTCKIESWNVPVKTEIEYDEPLICFADEEIPSPSPPSRLMVPVEKAVLPSIHCHLCTYVTRDKNDMDLHMRLHSTDAQFMCSECQESQNSLESLNQHFAVHHMKAISKHMTELRNDRSRDNQQTTGPQLYRYLTMDTSESAMSCLVCGAMYQWQWALAKHFEQDHSSLPNPYQSASDTEVPERLSPAKGGKPLKCNQCQFTATTLSDLTRHQIRHSLNKHHICKVCGYTARTKEELGDHYSEDHPSVDPSELQSVTGTVILHGTSQGEDSNNSDNGGLLGPDGKPLVELAGENIAIVIPQAPEESSARSKAGRKPNTSGPSSVDVLLPYKCNACEYRARWPSEITQHMKNHSDEKPFLCPRCTYRSKWKWDVVKHLKRCGGGTVKDVIDTTRLKKHQLANPLLGRPESIAYTQGRELSNGPPNVTVVPGGPMEKSPYNQSDNQSNSTDEEQSEKRQLSDPLECSHCSFVACSPSELKRHMKFHSYDVNQVYCTQCPFVGNNPAELKRHLRVHSDEKPFICKTCGYSSKWKCDLKKHCNTYNHTPAVPLTYGGHGRKPTTKTEETPFSDDQGDSFEDGEASDGCGEYKCEHCPFTSTSHGLYNAHMKIHVGSGDTPFKCKQCDYECDNLSDFLKHKLIHSPINRNVENEQMMNESGGESVSENGEPDQEVKDSGSGSSSRRKQSKQTIMKASVINEEENTPDGSIGNGKSAEMNAQIEQYVMNGRNPTVNGKVYNCTYCPYITHNRANFERHMPHHETSSKYSCEWCNWSSDRLNLLYRHAQVIHPGHVNEHEKEAFYDKVKDRCNYEYDGNVSPNDSISLTDARDLSVEFGDIVKANVGSGLPEGKKTKRRLKTCGKCGYITDNVTTLQRHMAKHGKLGKYTCTYCDYSVDKQHVLDYHTRLVHPKQISNPALLTDSMDGGDNTSNSTIDFNDNASIGNGSVASDNIADEDNSINLESADISTVQGEDVKIVHVGTRTVYGCTKCPYHTMKISGVLNHSRQHGQKKRFTCTYCDYSVDQSAHVKNHMKTVHGHNVDALNPTDLIRHNYDVEDMDSTDIASNDNDSEIQDDDSEFEPQSKRICLDNSNRKLQQSMFKCLKCSHATFDKIEWLKHKLVHMDEPRHALVKSHVCDKCPYRTGNKSQLEAHKTRHGFPSKYDCPYCDYSCGNATQQGNHVKLHFPEKQDDIDKNVLHLLIKGDTVEGFEPVVKNVTNTAGLINKQGDNNDSFTNMQNSSPKTNHIDINSNTAYGAH